MPGLDESLIALYSVTTAKALTAEQIAKQLSKDFGVDISRNAVIGRSRRLGLRRRPALVRAPAPAPASRQALKQSLAAKTAVVRAVPTAVIAAAAQAIAPPPELIGRMSLLALTDSNCHYPSDTGPPFLFCGDVTVSGSPYCAAHHKITRQK